MAGNGSGEMSSALLRPLCLAGPTASGKTAAALAIAGVSWDVNRERAGLLQARELVAGGGIERGSGGHGSNLPESDAGDRPGRRPAP